jgi:hypothetical protein
LRNAHRFGLLGLVVLGALAAFSQADAVQATKTYKVVELQFTVTPSPAPTVGAFFLKPKAATAQVAAALSAAGSVLVADPLAGPAQLAYGGPLSWDVAPGVMIAQTQAQPSPVPVQFNAQADPNAAYLKIVPGSAGYSFDVPYGTTLESCVFTITTDYTTAYELTDFGYGTAASGGTSVFPIYNYPTVSDLSWTAEAVVPTPSPTPSWTPMYNEGAPGQTVWSKAANVSYTGCISFKIVVPTTLAPGTYTAPIEYNLQVTI